MKNFNFFRDKFTKGKIIKETKNDQNGIAVDNFIRFSSRSFRELKYEVRKCNIQTYSKAFIIIIDMNVKEEQHEELCNILREILPTDREWIFQSKVENKLRFVSFKDGNDENLGTSLIILQKDSFDCQSFFDVLTNLNLSLADKNLRQNIEIFYENPQDENFFFDQAIDSKLLMFLVSSIFYASTKNESFFMRALKVRKLDIFFAFLGIFDESTLNVDEMLNVDKKLPVTLIENGNFEVFEFLMDFDAFTNSIPPLLNDTISTIEKTEFFHFLPFIKSLDKIPKFSLELEEDVLKLHNSIKAGKLNEVKAFVEKHPSMVLCYGPFNHGTPALEYAIDCKQFEIYSFLYSRLFATDRKKELDAKIRILPPHEITRIKKENLKYTIKDPTNGILNKCDFFASSKSMNFHNVHKMMSELNQIEEVREIMKIVADTEVKITFDFNNYGVNIIDPSSGEETLGIAYFTRDQLLIGRNRDESQRYGTSAHEMTHYGLYKLYDNGCLPYCKDDEDRKKIYDDVFCKSRQLLFENGSTVDEIISVVFELYPEGYVQEAELIVRVNEVLAHYYDRPDKIQEIERMFPELFGFYRNYVLKDLKIPKVHENKELNEKFGLLHKIKEWQVESEEPTDFLSEKNQGLKGKITGNHQTSSKKLQISSNVPLYTVSRINKELTAKYKNRVEKNARNIFIDSSTTKTLIKTLQDLSSIDRVIILTNDIERLRVLSNSEFDFEIIVVSPLKKIHETKKEIGKKATSVVKPDLENFKQMEDLHEWIHLNKDIKAKIESIPFSFNNEVFHLKDFDENLVSKEVLSVILAGEKSSFKDDDTLDKFDFIPRKICRHGKNDDQGVKVEGFLEQTESEKIVLITDNAGNGKTITLRQIERALKIKYHDHFIAFVSLREQKEVLAKIPEDFTNFVADKILKLNAFENLIFLKKYNENKVKILFDGFDEISPNFKDQTIKLLQLHKSSEKCQIFITARTHVQDILESSLNSAAYTLKSLSKRENINLLVNYWKHYKDNAENQELLRDCAEILVNKISDVFKFKSEFIGLLLPIKVLAEYYKEDLTENFANLPILQRMNVYEIYVLIFKGFVEKFDNPNNDYDVLSFAFPLFESFALKIFLTNKQCKNHHHMFDSKNCLNISDIQLEELARCGIISYNKSREVHFNHETFYEFLIARFIFETLLKMNANYKYLEDFVGIFIQILSGRKYEITRMFLNDVVVKIPVGSKHLEKFSAAFVRISMKKLRLTLFAKFIPCFQSSEHEEKFFSSFQSDNFFELFIFVLTMIRQKRPSMSKEVFQKIISQKVTTGNVLIKILENLKDEKKFEIFLNESFFTISKKKLFNLLLAKGLNGNSVFHLWTQDTVSEEKFSLLWTKIEDNFGSKEIQFIFNLKNDLGKNFEDYGKDTMTPSKLQKIIEIKQKFDI